MLTLPQARQGDMAEAAVTLPVVLLVAMFLINGALAAYAANVSANAAAYGARIGAVAEDDAQSWALNATSAALEAGSIQANYGVDAIVYDRPGGYVAVITTWQFPSYLSGLCGFFGVSCPANFDGESAAVFKKEGW